MDRYGMTDKQIAAWQRLHQVEEKEMDEIKWRCTDGSDNLDDDVVAKWKCLTLRCEMMQSDGKKRTPDLGYWWWAVYDEDSVLGQQVNSSNEVWGDLHGTGRAVRKYCEIAAKAYLWEREHGQD